MSEVSQNGLTSEEAAKTLGISPRTLEKWRRNGTGPAFCRFGSRVVYFHDDLSLWREERRFVPSRGYPQKEAVG